uniref:PDZ domain-containing protein n=2 Tax=Lotharella oceanica TaxID=641309 RepID=A0A7S2X7P9_9EUKA|mmetsp:Transcript_17319/g.32880  ORF Transcript_17319/g.32880 Transcript_17319/m.32880 type:complete len:193 (+) Transcript_17319:90-668(+)
MVLVEEVKIENDRNLDDQKVQIHRSAQLTIKFTGPLGMSIKGNKISSVSRGGLADKMGVKARTWHVAAVNGEKVPPNGDIACKMIRSSLSLRGEVDVSFSTSLMMVIFPQGALGMTLKGNRVVDTAQGGMASKAGVKPGCRITYVGHEKAPDNDDVVIAKILEQKQRTGQVTIFYERHRSPTALTEWPSLPG